MKRLCAILIALLLTAALFTACGSDGGTDNETDTNTTAGSKTDTADSGVDLTAVLDDINSSCGLTDVKAIEDVDSLKRYYRIEAEDVKQFAAELTGSSSDYTEIILIETTGGDAVDNVKTQLETRLRSQLSNAKSYDADQVGMLEACEVKVNGDFVYLIIGDMHEDAEAKVEAALS